MPVFYDYLENGESFHSNDEPLNPGNLSRYISEHGIAKAEGYHDALTDFIKLIDQVLFFPWNNGKSPNTPAGIRKDLKELHQSQQAFLEVFNETLAKQNPSADSSIKSPQN